MGMNEISIWILIRRYDCLESDSDELQSSVHHFTLVPRLTFDDLKLSVFCWIGVEDDGSRVLKIRNYDNKLIPLSALLNGSKQEKPFIIDVVRVHQFCPAKKRSVPPGYIEAIKSKLGDLEKRVILAENSFPVVTSSHIQALEAEAFQLANCVSFLDRRLDELAPAHWKSQIGSPI
ncbi:uncharacterized protein LOC107268890 [Cephus cinctus]|uniref:Uncharacterized protein LOC107268890 n=1 Tax=Cephus cinctus TaxID=211228 RepID=A0AAJ7RJ54_CEPCN|nr:uncharacterized protein LOC107268890 [Cephus cinctus]XP_024941906.1 uncharacterized protein LOC107268890 [Cephus cinctus]XP_024941907.1 uncharacterized protein LOC107268890 [Cephus cinctus]